jgi:rare lipoprotein A
MPSRRRRARPGTIGSAVLLAAVLVLASPSAAHQIQGWWKYDPAFWRHDYREHDELRAAHRRWHEVHRKPKRPGRKLERWKRRHTTMHHLRLTHPHEDMHYHKAVARQRGKASWYDLEGADGSCGAPLHGMYAAHPRWPCGTLVSVRTEERYVFVRVLDRGPHADGRVIDLAKRAFERLAPAGDGVIDVKIYRLEG